MKCLIINALAFKNGFKSSSQMMSIDEEKRKELYYKNSILSLISAKIINGVDAVLFTNEETSLIRPQYSRELDDYNIKMKTIPFDEFLYPNSFRWALAFFKLCALKYAIENMDYEYYILLDSDTITISSYDDMILDLDNNILLYNCNHTCTEITRSQIQDQVQKLIDKKISIEHYGGEIIAGKKHILKDFVEHMLIGYKNTLVNTNEVCLDLGDEYLISYAAFKMKESIQSANKYIMRYWTGRYYNVSTNWYFPGICIWHIPSEKNSGLIKLYKVLQKKRKIEKKKAASILGLPKARRNISISTLNYFFQKFKVKINTQVNNFVSKITKN